MKLKEREAGGQGLIAVWVNLYVEEDNDVIGRYDHDYSEGYSTDIKTPVEETITRMLLNKEAKGELLKRAQELNVQQIEYVFMLYNHCYEAAPGIVELTPNQRKAMKLESENSIPYFLGNFKK